MDLAGFDIPRYLATLPLFEGLQPEALARLAGACHLQPLCRQDMVFRVGQPCRVFHVAVRGQIKLFAISPSGQEKVIELVGPRHAFAEAPLFTGHRHTVNAQALTDALLLTIAGERVLAEIAANPRLALRMLAGVSCRLDGLMQGVQADALHSGRQRVIDFLLRHRCAPEGGPGATVSLPVSKATIASLLSLSPEYLSKVLRTLESAELIKMHRRDIRILDADRLATA